MKKISGIFRLLSSLLTNVLVAVVAYNYGAMKVGVKYGGYSAPAHLVFLYAIPFLIGILVCIVLSVYFDKHKKPTDTDKG